MRKILSLIMALTLILTIFALPCFADGEQIVVDEASEIEDNTIFGRIWEFVECNSELIINQVLPLITLILCAAFGKSFGNANKSIIGGLATAVRNTGNVTESQNGVIESVNHMEQKIDEWADYIKNIRDNEETREKMMASILVEITTVMQMLATVFPNSKNIPQGIKDLINIENANCLKTIYDDKALVKLYDDVYALITARGDSGNDEQN